MSSTIDTDSSASAPAPQPSKPSFFQRLAGVFMSPGETFRSIAQRPDWVAPLLLIFVVSLAAGVIIGMRVDFNAMAREAMEMNPKASEIPADRLDNILRVQAAVMKVSAFSSPILTALSLVVIAAVLLFSLRLFGGEGTFSQAFSVTLYGWMPRLIKGIITIVVVFARGNLGMFELQNPVMSNPGFLVDPRNNLLLYTLLSSFDIFALWSLVLLVIGFAVVSRLSKGKAAAVVVGWWVVLNLLLLVPPALQTLRK